MAEAKVVCYEPLSDLEMLAILQAILKAAWRDDKRFGVSVICGVTGRVMHFPMQGTMLVSCDRAEGRGIATKKAATLYLTQAESSREIGEEWLTKPAGKGGTQPHRELAYLGDPAILTGYEGTHRRVYDQEVRITLDCYKGPATLRKIVIISCSGDKGEVDAQYAEIGFSAFTGIPVDLRGPVCFAK